MHVMQRSPHANRLVRAVVVGVAMAPMKRVPAEAAVR